MTWEKLVSLAAKLPEVEEGIWFRTPALKVRGKSFCRLREDLASVVFLTVDVDEQEALIRARSDVFFITDHYRGYPAVCAWLKKLTVGEARVQLQRSWRLKAPKKLLPA